MKKYLLIFTLFGPLYGAVPAVLKGPQGLTLHEALDKYSSHRTMQQVKKTAAAGVVTAGAYGLSKTNILQEMFPELFPRSGTSYAIMTIIGVIAGSGGIWVLRDKFEEWGLRQKATEDMLKSSEILEKNLLPLLTEVQANQDELQRDVAKWGPKVAKALDNSVKAREGYEAVLASVEKIVGQMGDDNTALGQITALRDQVNGIQATLMKTHIELGDTTALANEAALAHLRNKVNDAPAVDELTRMANELGAASNRFKKTPEKKRKRWKFI